LSYNTTDWRTGAGSNRPSCDRCDRLAVLLPEGHRPILGRHPRQEYRRPQSLNLAATRCRSCRRAGAARNRGKARERLRQSRDGCWQEPGRSRLAVCVGWSWSVWPDRVPRRRLRNKASRSPEA